MNESNQLDRARLLAAAAPHTGAWLSAIPVACLGLLLPDDAVRVGVALRLGCAIQIPHKCCCGSMTDELGHHNLSCRFNAGRFPRHAALNDIVYRGLASAGIAAVLEPRGLDRGDGRRPDGITIFPFKRGKSLVWDATCVNTFSDSHLMECSISPGAAAEAAEKAKLRKYTGLCSTYEFCPLAIETTGVLGSSFVHFIKMLGRRIAERTGEMRETAWLRQRISLAVVMGNAAAFTKFRFK